MSEDNQRADKYWVCDDCASKRNWVLPDDYVGTVTSGLCGNCDRQDETVLIPCRDFNGPNKKAWFD